MRDSSKFLQLAEVTKMSNVLAPFIKWGDCKSHCKDRVDSLELQVLDPQTFETQYSTNVRVLHKDNGEWIEKILPLKSHESANSALLNEWNKYERKDILHKDRKFKIETCLDISKNDRTIRRFKILF